jgi:hypothetical protein
VHKLDTAQLETIAGEDVQTKVQREMLEIDIRNLKEVERMSKNQSVNSDIA